jgi:MFS family permease
MCFFLSLEILWLVQRCVGAPNSLAVILGRAIQGIGSAGIFAGCMIIIVGTVPLQKRPMYIGLLRAVFELSVVIGPLLGVHSP